MSHKALMRAESAPVNESSRALDIKPIAVQPERVTEESRETPPLVLSAPGDHDEPDFLIGTNPVGIELIPITQRARSWCETNLIEPLWSGRGYVIEREYFRAIGEAFTADGLLASSLGGANIICH